MIGREIYEMQTLGISRYVAGDHIQACQIWYTMMLHQENLALDNGLDISKRYLRGESWTNGIGHIALLDFFVKRKLLKLSNADYTLVTRPGVVANEFYLNLWEKYLLRIKSDSKIPNMILTEDFPMVLKVGDEWHPFMTAIYMVQRMWEQQERKPLIELPEEYIEKGWNFLRNLGIQRDAWFAAIHVREHGFASGTTNKQSTRNADLVSYSKAIRVIIDAGGYPIRFDKRKASQIVPGLIDCGASNPDWFDIFLISQCRFYIGTNSGPSWVAGTFGKPILLTNWSPVGVPFAYKSNKLYKKFMSEYYNPKMDNWKYAENYEWFIEHQIAVYDNSPEELESAVKGFMLTC